MLRRNTEAACDAAHNHPETHSKLVNPGVDNHVVPREVLDEDRDLLGLDSPGGLPGGLRRSGRCAGGTCQHGGADGP